MTSSPYAPEILEQLAAHGIRPLPHTPPERVREHLRDLYIVEITRLRDEVRGGRLARRALADAVITLRKRYWLLSVPVEHWRRIGLSPAGPRRAPEAPLDPDDAERT
ncbi:MAG: hypothetical protein U0Q12_21250 [Vicinamibacterales bacterium]